MLVSRMHWSLLSVLLGISITLANGEELSEGGCYLSLTQPCRSNTSLCVPHEHVGDGVIDCPDGSDEDCPDGWFICADLSACIEPRFLHDGVPQCHDDSDEECEQWQHECLCGFPRCIDGDKVGDGVLDCVEGSDELAIEKESYICPTDLQEKQEILRKKRRAFETQAGVEPNGRGITNFYSVSPGASAPTGVLTSTVYSFVNKETTSEYLTYVKGTSIDGSYAQVTSLSSRTFFALPTLLKEHQVDGLVSSFIRTTVSNGYTQTIVSRIYHTSIDGAYAQLVETETRGVSPTSVNYVTILQGEELHGTFLSHPDHSLATLQFSHLEGSLNPSPVAAEIVTVNGTYGKFIRDGPGSATTYSVFTGSYIKDQKTYVFFFGNSALPHQRTNPGEHMDKINMKQGHEKRKVILDMDEHMEVIMPSDLKMNMASKDDLLIGEGIVDGHKVDGLFIADSEGFDVKGAHKRGGGDIKMLTVTIGQPSTVIMKTGTVTPESDKKIPFFDISKQIETEADNEVDSSLLRGRKASIHGDEIVVDIHNIQPTIPLPNGIPTFVIEEPNQNIGDILLREKIKMSRSSPASAALQHDNVVENLKAKFNQFNIGDFALGDSVLPTVTYYGFAEFTTTIADTVVIFTPNSKIQSIIDRPSDFLSDLQGRVVSSEAKLPPVSEMTSKKVSGFFTTTTKVFNTIDLYPSGLVSSIGGTLINDGTTTLFTTLVYGTYIQDQYAQVVRSTSSIFYLVSHTASPSVTPTKMQEVVATKSPSLSGEEKDLSSNDDTLKIKGNIFDTLFSDFQADNAIGRSVDGKSNERNLNNIKEMKTEEKEELLTPSLPIVSNASTETTFTLYTTFVKDGTTTVDTNYETTTGSPLFEIVTKPASTLSELSTLTYHTTKVLDGTTQIKSSLKVVTISSVPPTPPSNLFFNILGSDSNSKSDTLDTAIEKVNEAISETATESSTLDTTEATGFSLESSLNPDDAVNAIYFPRTYYTTYTYFTTYHRFNTSSIVSSLETITNIISDDSELQKYKTLTPAIPTYPVTYWTTYTYWTTLVKDNSSITTSSKKTVSNILNLTGKGATTVMTDKIPPIKPTSASIEETPTQDITTYYTTYTYYTTATIGDSIVVSSRLETDSSIVTGGIPLKTLASDSSSEPFGVILDISTRTLDENLHTQTETIESPFESIFEPSTEKSPANVDDDLTTDSGLGFLDLFSFGNTETVDAAPETESAVKLFDQSVTKTVNRNLKIGLLSTVRRSTVADGITTLLSTNIYGTYVGGLYTQIQSTMSEILETTANQDKLKQIGVLTVDAGSIIENEVTTHYITQHVGKYVNGKYTEEHLSTSRTEVGHEKSVTEANPTKTGRVREIIGSVIHGTKTTYYHSTILGTVIAGIYAQKVESTSRFVSGPSIAFDILTDLPTIEKTKLVTTALLLEPSLEATISPTPVIVATESLELENTIKNNAEEGEVELESHPKNRLSFPIRTSSKRRTDVFPFIRRTSTFRKQDALSKVLAAPTTSKIEETVTPTPEPKTEKPKPLPKPIRHFRFGFLEKLSNRRDKNVEKSEKKFLLVSEAPPTARKIPDSTTKRTEETGTTTNFRPFRFLEKTSSSNGTRSSLPISRRPRPSAPDAKQTQQTSRFRFGSLPESTTERAKIPATTTTEASTSKRPNPFAFLGRPLSEKRKDLRNRKPETKQPTLNKTRRVSTATESSVDKKTPRPRTRLGGLFPRRRPITPKLNKEESQVNPVYLHSDGTSPDLNSDDIDIVTFNMKDVVHRKKRQAPNFGSRTSSRGIRRFVRTREADSNDNKADKISPSPSEPEKSRQPFTLSNPRSSRPTLRRHESGTALQKPASLRTTISRSKSRNTLPFRPRRPSPSASQGETSPKKGFRRPSNDNRFKISSRFRPRVEEAKNEETVPARRPSQFTVNRNRSPVRKQPPKNNPIQSFLERPKPLPKPKPVLLPSDDGSFNIVDALTVTREVPVTTTIPLIENGNTIKKKVITASLLIETVNPEQITQTEIDGEIKLLLSTVENKQQVTQVFIQPIPTTTVTYSPVFFQGKQTSEPHTMPITLYSIVTATTLKTESDVQDLLKLLILQQQQQNPFLAALGLNQPRVQHETRTFVTTITSLVSTEIPIIFRGKPIRTTVVDTNIEVITTTEITTKTVTGSPVANPSPFGPLLPLLLQNQLNRKARDIRPTQVVKMHQKILDSKIHSGVRVKRSDLASEKKTEFAHLPDEIFVLMNEIEILPAFSNVEGVNYNIPTPPLTTSTETKKTSSNNSFLWKGPAEFAPLQRKVRSAQRGKRVRQRVRLRSPRARKITSDVDDKIQILDQIVEKDGEGADKFNNVKKATTFYTTFTYYTTYLDDHNKEIVKSSEETITQVATYGNIRFDDFTKTNPSSAQKVEHTAVPVQEKFTLKDAIIPGRPRPVPDPVFKEPDPPHGPIIRHDEVVNIPISNDLKTKRRKTVIRLRNPSRQRGNARKQKNKIRLSNPVTVLSRNSLSAGSESDSVAAAAAAAAAAEQMPLEITGTKNIDGHRRVRITITKKRPVKVSSAVGIIDKSTVDSGGRKRIVITRRLPQQQAISVAPPVDPFMETASTLFTVYSYLYSIYDEIAPISDSTRVITVSNIVEPTVVNVPENYQTVSPTSNFYTIEKGDKIATLGDRIENGYTTKIFLSSAILANIRPKLLHHSAVDLSSSGNFNEEDIDYNTELKRELFDGIFLQSSLQEVTPISTLKTLTFTRPSIKRTRKITGQDVQIEETQTQDVTNTVSKKAHDNPEDSLKISTDSKKDHVPKRLSTLSEESRTKYRERGRRPPSRRLEETTPFTEAEELLETTTSIPNEKDDRKILTNIFDKITAVKEDEVNSPSPPIVDRPPRPSVRRDDIPIIRRPQGQRPPRPPASSHQLKFASTTESGDQPLDVFSTRDETDHLTPDLSFVSPKAESVIEPPPSVAFSFFDTLIPKSDENSSFTDVTPVSETESVSKDILDLHSTFLAKKSDESKNLDYHYYDEYFYDENEQETPLHPETVGATTEEFENTGPLTAGDPYQQTTKPAFDILGFLNQDKSDSLSSFKKGVDTDSLIKADISPPLEPGVDMVYTTYTTSTLLPILGGKQSITLTLLTSSLVSLKHRSITPTYRSIHNPETIYTTSSPLKSDKTPLFGTLSSDSDDISGPQSLGNVSSHSVLLEENVTEGRQAAFDNEAPQHRFAEFGLDGRHKLATKVMENGVEVIVAEDASFSGERESTRDILRPTAVKVSPHPITLPPSTLSNQMLLFASPVDKSKVFQIASVEDDRMFHFKTYFTTLTYYNTLLQRGTPVVRTSKETISNIVSAPLFVSGNFVEKTKINLETSTYLATQTFTKTIGDLQNPQIVTSKEVITQVVVTEVPSVSRTKIEITPTFSTIVTKTYLTTFTYYKTYNEGHVETETVISSNIVTETSVEATASLPVVSLAKSPHLASDVTPFNVFATKTYYTTSTYLTTILEGLRTITSSHTEITSNVRTEPITSVINTEDILLHGSTIYPGKVGNDQFEKISYLSVDGNVFKEFRTLFATYTHYTTLHNGRVKSSEITKTEVLTSTITTASVPVSLLVKTDGTPISPQTISDQPEITSAVFDNNFKVQLDPSYTESVTTLSPIKTISNIHPLKSNGIKESSGLKATVHVEEGSETGTSVVHDSTTKATLLVRPNAQSVSGEVIRDFKSSEVESLSASMLASSQLSLIETTTLPSFNLDISFESVQPTSSISILQYSTVLHGENNENITLTSGDKVIVLTQTSGEKLYLPHMKSASSFILSETSVKPEPTSSVSLPVRIEDPPVSIPVRVANVASTSGDVSTQTETTDENVSENEGSSFGFGLSPMLTAVAGLIGNTFVGKLAGQAEVRRSKIDEVILPKNAIVAAEKEPLLIPVGGVGASLSSVRHSTTEPESGFIPLRRPEPNKPYAPVTPDDGFVGIESFDPRTISTQTHFPVSMEKFGPSFQPPVETESGFTAMTKPINPTKVSVISGEETIFFGGFDSLSLPPPGQPASAVKPHNLDDVGKAHQTPIHLAEGDNDKITSHLIHSESESQDILLHPKDVPLPGLINFEAIYTEGDDTVDEMSSGFAEEEYIDPTFLEATVGIGDAPRETAQFPLHVGEEGRRTTVVKGSSTVMSGATTIFDTLFTKPLHADTRYSEDKSGVDSLLSSNVQKGTKHTIHSDNHSRYEFVDGFPMPVTKAEKGTHKLRTIVPTVVDVTTKYSTLEPISNPNTEYQTPINFYEKTKLRTVTLGSSTAFDPNYDDSELYRNAEDYSETILENEANLGYEEENEVSRFIESLSPDQEVGEPQKPKLCERECNVNEMCMIFRQEHVCLCKPGYSRRTPRDKCAKSNSFQVDIVLERLNDNSLSFSEELKNKTHPNTQFLIKEIDAGIEKAMIKSDLGEKYQSSSIIEFDEHSDKDASRLVARVKIDIDKDEGEGKYLTGSVFSVGESTDETLVRHALEDSLYHSNYSLGGGEILARKESAVLAATDFDECQSEEHNDCHEDARCINMAGSFTCQCKEGFRDFFSDENPDPGRLCIESHTCSFCNYHGKCLEDTEEKTLCICNDWFSGERCEINMKVMLIAVVSVGAFLILLLAIFIVFCCCRTRKDSQGGFLRPSSHGEPSTLDRRAMIHDSSSESSEDLTRIHTGTLLDGKLPPIPRTPQADYSIGRRSAVSNMSKDRSMTVHTSIPSVLIPRIKGYNTSSRAYTLERESDGGGKFIHDSASAREAALVDILDGGPCPHMTQEADGKGRETILSIHSFGHRSRSRECTDDDSRSHHHHHHWHRESAEADTIDYPPRSRSASRSLYAHHNGSTYRSNSTDRLGNNVRHDLTSETGASSFRYGDRAVSQARSYDETTVRAPIRTLKGESFRSRDVSSQVLSEGMPTNAERDGNSTIVYPQMQLYKPLREADSASDLTGHPKHHGNNIFE